MPTKEKYKHPTLKETAHDIAKALYKIEAIDTKTMRDFDLRCLPETKKLSGTQIKKLRVREKVSQPVFANCLNISPATVKKWEQGEKKPSGSALKMLNLIEQKGLDYINPPRD